MFETMTCSCAQKALERELLCWENMNADWSRYILKEQHVDLIRICYKKLKILPFKYVAISAELPENEKMHVFCSL